MERTKRYPECFPGNFETEILPKGAKGQTEGSCGPSQLTSEREERTDTHVEWWLYQDSEPQNFFREVKKDE